MEWGLYLAVDVQEAVDGNDDNKNDDDELGMRKFEALEYKWKKKGKEKIKSRDKKP